MKLPHASTASASSVHTASRPMCSEVFVEKKLAYSSRSSSPPAGQPAQRGAPPPAGGCTSAHQNHSAGHSPHPSGRCVYCTASKKRRQLRFVVMRTLCRSFGPSRNWNSPGTVSRSQPSLSRQSTGLPARSTAQPSPSSSSPLRCAVAWSTYCVGPCVGSTASCQKSHDSGEKNSPLPPIHAWSSRYADAEPGHSPRGSGTGPKPRVMKMDEPGGSSFCCRSMECSVSNAAQSSNARSTQAHAVY